MTFKFTSTDRSKPRAFWRPGSDINLTIRQEEALLAHLDSAIPNTVSEGTRTSLRDLGLIRPTGPRHRSHHITPAGERVVMAIFSRQHIQYARPLHAIMQLKAEMGAKAAKQSKIKPVATEAA